LKSKNHNSAARADDEHQVNAFFHFFLATRTPPLNRHYAEISPRENLACSGMLAK
jgi:hypothetical protein